MNLNITGRHVEVTEALEQYAREKLEHVIRHFDHVTSCHVILSVEKNEQKAECTLHVKGKDIHAHAVGADELAEGRGDVIGLARGRGDDQSRRGTGGIATDDRHGRCPQAGGCDDVDDVAGVAVSGDVGEPRQAGDRAQERGE